MLSLEGADQFGNMLKRQGAVSGGANFEPRIGTSNPFQVETPTPIFPNPIETPNPIYPNRLNSVGGYGYSNGPSNTPLGGLFTPTYETGGFDPVYPDSPNPIEDRALGVGKRGGWGGGGNDPFFAPPGPPQGYGNQPPQGSGLGGWRFQNQQQGQQNPYYGRTGGPNWQYPQEGGSDPRQMPQAPWGWRGQQQGGFGGPWNGGGRQGWQWGQMGHGFNPWMQQMGPAYGRGGGNYQQPQMQNGVNPALIADMGGGNQQNPMQTKIFRGHDYIKQ